MRPRLFTLISVITIFFICVVTADDKKPEKKTPPSIKISKETTRIDGPLDKDGFVNYIEALNERLGKGVTPKNNAAVTIVTVMGPNGGELRNNEDYKKALYKRLGIKAPPKDGDYVVSMYELAKEEADKSDPPGDLNEIIKGYNDEHQESMEAPWAKEDFPNVSRWLAANEKPLAILREGLKRERCYLPLVTVDEPTMLVGVLLPVVQSTRSIARLLIARAMLRVQEGNLVGAREDLMTCHRLARHVAQGPTMVERLVGVAIESIALSGDRVVAHSGHLMTDQALKFRAEIEKLPPIPRMADSIDTAERFMFLDATQHFAKGTAGINDLLDLDADGGSSITKMLSKTLVDWNEPMKIGNKWYDKIVAGARKPTYLERSAAAAALDEEMKEFVKTAKDPKAMALKLIFSGSPRKAIGQQMGKILVALLLPAVNAANRAEARVDMLRDLTRVTIALAAYKNDHGEFPETLDKLMPKYIPKIPEDFYVEKPLRYSRTDTGYVLYAQGPNGKDDNGSGPFHNHLDGDDIAVRFPRPIPE